RTAGDFNSFFHSLIKCLDSSVAFSLYEAIITDTAIFDGEGVFPDTAYDSFGEIIDTHSSVVAATPLFHLLKEIERKAALFEWLGFEDRTVLYVVTHHDLKFGIKDLKNLNWLDVARLK